MTNIEILRGELERLFSLEELTSMSEKLLGLDPKDVGGAAAKGSFAKALTERCVDGDRIEALVDVILTSRSEVDPRVRDISSLLGEGELAPGTELGPYVIEKRLGVTELGVTFAAKKGGKAYTLKTLRREAARDRRAAHRFLTANRLVSSVAHAGLPKDIDAGEIVANRDRGSIFYVAYEHIDAPTLGQRLQRMGATHWNDLRPILRGILQPLAALHKAQLVHGDLKLDHVLLPKVEAGGEQGVVLIDFGGDRLRPRLATMNGGGFGFLAVFGSPKTIAPEQVRGRPGDARTDVYAFGAMVYELLSGKPVFAAENPTDAAFLHIAQKPEAPSAKAPRGWISKELDEWVLSMLAKDPAQRPRDASALLEAIDRIGRSVQSASTGAKLGESELATLIAALHAAPANSEAAISLEKAIDQGADAHKVAAAFSEAAGKVDVSGDDESAKEAKKALLFRAARIYDGAAQDKEKAESTYAAVLELDPSDEIASVALEAVRKSLGKFEEIVEMLLERSENASPGEERARVMAEIGRLYNHELDDSEQALVAFTQALCEAPDSDEYAAEIERIAGQNAQRWNEVLGTLTEGVKEKASAPSERNALLARAGDWYDQKAKRPDMALMAFQQILVTEPASEVAQEGLTVIYRRAQQWPELAQVLLSRADATASSPRARDLRSEAAELFELRLNDVARAKEIYLQITLDDPGHAKASEALSRIAEREGDFPTLVDILDRRAEALRGSARADAMVKVAEVYEDHLNDLAQATQRFEAALAIDETNLGALKGLDRIYNRLGKYRELLEVLERQVAVAATPRQKINLFERTAAIYDEEFLDQVKAAEALEQVLAIDASNDAALSALPRLYRVLNRWDDAVKLYERHAELVSGDGRKIELLVAKARMLSEQVGSPERAIKTYEQVLQLEPNHPAALEALAALKESSGDAHAALSAIESLAAKAATPEAKAEQWIRAARLLDARGDKDGAIERYKMALESNPKDAAASSALRQAYGQRGDYASVLALIEKELPTAEGDLAKARLLGEQAKVYLTRLKEDLKAEQSAKRALELDGTNADALLVLGDLAFEADRMMEASKYYESLAGRTGVLPKEDAVRALVRFIESVSKNPPAPPSTESVPSSMRGDSLAPGSSIAPRPTVPPTAASTRILTAVEALQRLAPEDVHSLATAAKVLLDQNDAATARKVYSDLVQKHDKALAGSDRAEVLYGYGESMRRLGELDAAIPVLVEASQSDAASPLPLRALARVYEARGDWNEVVKAKKRRLDVASGQERFDLLIEIGDAYFNKLNDRALASKTYVAALEEKPDDRRLLTRLMQFYSEEKDWAKLVDVVVRLADFVEDPKQRAKYMHTAAIVSARQIGDRKQALAFYDRVLEFDPTFTKAVDEALEIRRQDADHDGVERMLKMQLEAAKQAGDRVKLPEVLDQLGELYQKFLNEPDLAVDAYEAAQAFDPENKQRSEILAELYASDVAQYLDKAVKAQAQILRRNPYRVESYKLLRKLFTDAQKADAAWCLCQALSVMNLAEPDEERFYKRHKAETAAPAKAAFDQGDWERIAHYDQDALLTKLFTMIQPTIVRARTQPLDQMGYDARYAIDLTLHPYPVSQTLYYAAGVLGLAPPQVFQNPNDPAGLGFLHATTPAIVLGRAAFEAQVPPQSLAFLAGRHLTYFKPGYYVRHLVPTGTGLKAWLFAAIKLCNPQFPIAPDLHAAVGDAMASMQVDFQGPQKDQLASLVAKLLQNGVALDLKKWVASVDLTADRVGFALAHDLSLATEVIRATEDGASVPVKERMKEIVLYGVSEEYFALRERLMITIAS